MKSTELSPKDAYTTALHRLKRGWLNLGFIVKIAQPNAAVLIYRTKVSLYCPQKDGLEHFGATHNCPI